MEEVGMDREKRGKGLNCKWMNVEKRRNGLEDGRQMDG